ncbi:MAG: hypothetical protein LBM07_07190 [Culturomica sp.]|jgi:hypothetical protein|nr:hypothetical protein [Culturomica sp.]
MKTVFNNIPEEELAAFIDGQTTELESRAILDAIGTAEELETVLTARAAAMLAEANIESLATDSVVTEKEVPLSKLPPLKLRALPRSRALFEPLPMAGFLGDNNEGDSQAVHALEDETPQ